MRKEKKTDEVEEKEDNDEEVETSEAVEDEKPIIAKKEEPLHIVAQVPTEYANVIVNTKTKKQYDVLTALAKVMNNTQEIIDRL